jgi:hypothetical protein
MYPRQNILGNLVLTAGILASVICQAQEDSAKPSLAQLLRQLGSSQWRDRARAYEKLRSDSKVLSDHRVQDELLNLLGRETGFIRRKPGDPEPDDIPDEQNEAYAEYVGYLGGTVESFADWSGPSQVWPARSSRL